MSVRCMLFHERTGQMVFVKWGSGPNELGLRLHRWFRGRRMRRLFARALQFGDLRCVDPDLLHHYWYHEEPACPPRPGRTLTDAFEEALELDWIEHFYAWNGQTWTHYNYDAMKAALHDTPAN